MSDNLTVERVDLQKKDKSELQTIVIALGGKPASRATKADLIESVLELSGAVAAADSSAGSDAADDSPQAEADALSTDEVAGSDAKPDETATRYGQGNLEFDYECFLCRKQKG